MDNSSQVIILGMILLFVLLFSVFFVKPIILTLIRWIFFYFICKIRVTDDEVITDIKNDKVKDLSQSLFSELNKMNKESEEDLEKIKKIVNYQEKRKRE